MYVPAAESCTEIGFEAEPAVRPLEFRRLLAICIAAWSVVLVVLAPFIL